MANVTSVPTATQETFFQWGTPTNPNPRLAAPVEANATTYQFTAPPLDHNSAVISVDFLMGVRDVVTGYVTNVYVPASGLSVDGLTATNCVSGIALEGLDWTTGDPDLAPAIAQDSPIFCVVSGVERAMTQAGLTGQIGVASKFNKATTFQETGILADRVFADATARDAAIVTPTNGMSCYNSALGAAQDYIAGAWVTRAAGATPNGDEATAGKFQGATTVEMAAGTDLGGTGAHLVPMNKNLVSSSSGAGDAGKLPVLNGSGQFAAGFINYSGAFVNHVQDTFTFGEAIDGTVTPQAAYLKASDGKVYKTIGTGTESTFKFIGFVTTNVLINTSGIVITEGAVTGFAGLTTDSDYFITDVAGAIGITAGTNIYKVARATSTTQILIEKGIKIAVGTDDFSTTAGGNNDLTVTIGFKPRFIELNYFIQGYSGTNSAASYAAISGILEYSQATLVSNLQFGSHTISADLAPIINLLIPQIQFTAPTNPEIGDDIANSGIIITLSVHSISDTGFVLRRATQIQNTPQTARSKVCYKVYG